MAHQRQPVIGITCTLFQSRRLSPPPRFGQNAAYVRAVIRAGGAPFLIPSLADRALLRVLYERVDGLLLAGGGDIDPARYGEPRHDKCGQIFPDRDEAESTLACWALEEAKPLLAICRGIQIVNVALGGSLYQDIASQLPGAGNHAWYPNYPRDLLPHTVGIERESRLGRILGVTSMPVNSLHHQAVKDLAPGLIVTARAPDRIIEALEVENHTFALGVQWHPEELAESDTRAQRLFDTLVGASQR